MDISTLMLTKETYDGNPVYRTQINDETRKVVRKECLFCGEDKFSLRYSLAKRENNHGEFCSKSCASKYTNCNRKYTGDYKEDYIKNIKERTTCLEEGCDESRPEALCFHHKAEYEKLGNISRMATTAEHGIEELKEEVQKCKVICNNCHREKHANTEQEIKNHTIDWDSYTEIDRKIEGNRVFRNEASKKCMLRDCEFCGQEFLARVDSYNRGKAKFCSLRCAGLRIDRTTKAGLVKNLKREGECSSVDCSESRPHCLEFHHNQKEDKNGRISQIVESGDMKDLKDELKKCKLLCSNCHRVEHSN